MQIVEGGVSLIPQSDYLKGKRRILPGEIKANGVFSGATRARLASPRGAPVTSWLHGTFQTRATSPSSCSRLTWGPQSCVKAGPTHLRMQCSGAPAGGAGLGACVCGLQSSGWWVSLAPSPHPAPGSRWCVCVRVQPFRLHLPIDFEAQGLGTLRFRLPQTPVEPRGNWLQNTEGELKVSPHPVLDGFISLKIGWQWQ